MWGATKQSNFTWKKKVVWLSKRNVKLGDMAEAISEIIQEYSDDVIDEMPNAVKKAGKTCLKELKAAAASAVGGSRYKQSFATKMTKSDSRVNEVTIYSKMPGLPHLLEHGHFVENQYGVYGISPAHPHWAPAEHAGAEALEKNIRKGVEQA